MRTCDQISHVVTHIDTATNWSFAAVVFISAYPLASSPENFAQSEVTQLAFYKSKAASLFNAMVPGK